MDTDEGEDTSAKGSSRHLDNSKRKLLRLIAFAGAGGAVAVLLSGSLTNAFPDLSSESTVSPGETTGHSVAPIGDFTASPIMIKVRFLQMSQVVPKSQEYFAIRSPGRYSDLLSAVLSKYPVIGGMIPTMMVLVDGVPARAATPLEDGDEVDFIPALGGG